MAFDRLLPEQKATLINLIEAIRTGNFSREMHFVRTRRPQYLLLSGKDGHDSTEIEIDAADIQNLINEGYLHGNDRRKGSLMVVLSNNAYFEYESMSRGENDLGEAKSPERATDTRIVFVVHGRDTRLRDAMFGFLRALDLTPLEWEEARNLTGNASPYIGEILNAAFHHAQAVVVLLSPDDQVVLRTDLQHDHDPEHERSVTGQARPNVLFEAGMALATDEKRTVLVEIGELRPFSDVGGRHVVRLSESPAARKRLADRLRTAGCPVNYEGEDWITAGDFTPPESAERHVAEDPIATTTRDRLTAAGIKVLSAAWGSDSGDVHRFVGDGAIALQAGGKRIFEGSDGETTALIDDTIDHLLTNGLLREVSENYFQLTTKAYELGRDEDGEGDR